MFNFSYLLLKFRYFSEKLIYEKNNRPSKVPITVSEHRTICEFLAPAQILFSRESFLVYTTWFMDGKKILKSDVKYRVVIKRRTLTNIVEKYSNEPESIFFSLLFCQTNNSDDMDLCSLSSIDVQYLSHLSAVKHHWIWQTFGCLEQVNKKKYLPASKLKN